MENTNPEESNRIIIPKLFYDSLNDAPFTNCLMCNRHLLMNPTTYMIEKAYRKNPVNGKKEIIFEYAICWNCISKFTESYSKKSMANITEYFNDNIVRRERSELMKIPEAWNKPDFFLSKCSIKGTPVKELDEYQVLGYFYGRFMTLDSPPFLFSGAVSDEILSILSEQTLDELDDFTGKYLTGPPEFSDFLRAPKRKPVILL